MNILTFDIETIPDVAGAGGCMAWAA